MAISNVANVKFELPRPLNPGYSFQLCCVAKTGDCLCKKIMPNLAIDQE